MTTRLALLGCLIILSISSAESDQSEQKMKFSASEVKEDFKYLYKTLEQAHYNLYVNTKKEVFEKQYEKVYNSINDSLTLLEITRLFQPFTALSKLAHCNISFPWNLYLEKNNQSDFISI